MSASSSRMHVFLDALSSNNNQQQQNRSLENAVMESSLRVVSRKYRRQLNILKPMAEVMLQETAANPGAAALRRMLAFRKSLGAFEASVAAVRSAVSEVLSQRQDLLGLCLSNPESCEEMELLLEAYNADLKEILLELSKMKEQIEDTNDFISMHLDSMRNKIMRMGLFMEMGTLSAGAGALIAGMFGMNLTSGFESHPEAFYVAVGGIFVLAGGLFGVFSRRFAAMNRDYSGAKGYLALKHFFMYVENLEEAVQRSQGGQGLREDEFRQLLEPLIDVHLTREEVGAIFKVLDENRDGILNVEDLSAALSHDKTSFRE